MSYKLQIFYFLNLNKYFLLNVLDVCKYGKNKNILRNLREDQIYKKSIIEIKFQKFLFVIFFQEMKDTQKT